MGAEDREPDQIGVDICDGVFMQYSGTSLTDAMMSTGNSGVGRLERYQIASRY
jgi:hypothetical protein